MAEVLKGWCSACGAWRRMIWGPQIGGRCATCGSGRIRAPRQGEKVPNLSATRAPGDDEEGE